MSIIASANVGTVAVRFSLSSSQEDHEARLEQSCFDMADSSLEAKAQANRIDLPAAGGEILDTPTTADRLREQSSALDRFKQ